MSGVDYSIVPDTDYKVVTYEPPTEFARTGARMENWVVGNSVEEPNSILSFVSGDDEQKAEYISGLLGIGLTLFFGLVVWFLVLLVLKCVGRDKVGCAAGHAFHDSETPTPEEEGDKDADEDKPKDDADPVAKDDDDKLAEETPKQEASPEVDDKPAEETPKQEASPEVDESESAEEIAEEEEGNCIALWLCSFQPQHVETRKNQTRIVFGIFAFIAFCCCIALFPQMYKPMKRAAFNTGELVEDVADMIGSLNDVVVSLDDATLATSDFLETTPFEYAEICPGVAEEKFEEKFGFNPIAMVNIVSGEYATALSPIKEALTQARSTSESINDIINDIHSGIGSASDYMWIIVLLIVFTMMVILSQLVLMLVVHYRPDIDTKNIEKWFGWTVLPFQVFSVIVSWIFVIVFFFAIVLSTDTCMPSFNLSEKGGTDGRGTPDDLIIAVADQYITKHEATLQEDGVKGVALEKAVNAAKKRLVKYIVGCDGIFSDRDGDGRALGEPDFIFEDYAFELEDFDQDLYEFMDRDLEESNETLTDGLLGGALGGVGDSISDSNAAAKVNNTLDKVNTIQESNGTIVGGVVSSAGDTIKESDAAEKVNNTLGTISNAKDKVNNTVSTIQDSNGTIVGGVVSGAGNVIKESDAAAKVNNTVDKVGNTISNVNDTIREMEPLQKLIEAQEKLQAAVKAVEAKLAFARDVVQMKIMEGECGANNRVRGFVTSLSVLNGEYFDVLKSVKGVFSVVSCPTINQLYVDAVYGIFCTDFATISANGFNLLFLIAFCGMILITLRASWRSV